MNLNGIGRYPFSTTFFGNRSDYLNDYSKTLQFYNTIEYGKSNNNVYLMLDDWYFLPLAISGGTIVSTSNLLLLGVG